jgi:seryl-tRNA synthetase
MPSPAQQGAPPPGQIAPALTGAGGANLPAAFNVQQAMSYLQKQNPNADPATLFQALGQMGGMWEQLHPQAKQDYQLVRDNIKAQMQMDMLRERLNAIDEQIDRRGELAKIRDGILEQGRDRRASQSEQGKDARQNTRETGIENRFDKRQDWLDAKRSTKAATQDIADQKTEINDQISKLNKERAAIKNALPFGQAAPNSPEQKKLQELAKQIDDLSDKKIMLDRAMRQARVGGGKEPGAGPDATPREKEQGPGQQGDYKSADDVVAAYKNGKIDHDAASKILKENGWAE